MLKLLFISMLLISINSFAEDSSSGCGLGWKVAPKQSLVSSYTRSLINATASNSFGMTSGTSGCAKHSIVYNEKRGIHFVESNYHQLIVDASKGQGIFLDAFADIINYTGDKKIFAKMIQENFNRIYTKESTTPSEFYNNFKNVVLKLSNS